MARESQTVDWSEVRSPLGLPGQQSATCTRTTYYRLDDSKPERTPEVHFWVTSAPADAHDYGQVIRDHWRIENSLHHVKDRTWLEDRHWIGSPRTGAIVSILRSVACCLVRKAPARALPANAHAPERIEYYQRKPHLALRRITGPLRL